MSGIKLRNHEYSYTMIESAKLLCQYKDLIEDTLHFNKSFTQWYALQSEEDFGWMELDQNSRKVKQVAKNAGKILGFLGGLIIGVASISKSPTKNIAENASYDEEIWLYLIANNITYKTLRKFL